MKPAQVKRLLLALSKSSLTENEAIALFACHDGGTDRESLSILLNLTDEASRKILTKLERMGLVHKYKSGNFKTNPLGVETLEDFMRGVCPNPLGRLKGRIRQKDHYFPPIPPPIPPLPPR